MNDKFSLGSKTITMSFGLLNVLCKTVGEVDGAALMSLDNDLREEVLIQILSERDAEGTITARAGLFAIEASVDEVTDLLTWAQGHIIDFFVKAAETTQKKSEELKPRVAALKHSSNGGAA